MSTYILLSKFNNETRKDAANLPARLEELAGVLEADGVKVVNQWLTLGSYEHAAVLEADDAGAIVAVLGKAASVIETDTNVLGAFSLAEAKQRIAA